MINLTAKRVQHSTISTMLKSKFSYIEQKKEVDFNKKCIQLMQKPTSPSLSSDFLKLSNQYNSSICSKIFYWMNKELSLGESATLIVESDYKLFEEKTSYKFIRKILVKALSGENEEMEHVELHKNNNLVNYIDVVCFFERNQDTEMSRVMMAILANFVEKGEEIINPLDYSRAISFLTSRCYISSNIVLYFKSLSMDLDFLNHTISRCQANEIVPLFETVANTLQSALKIQKMQYHDCLKEKTIIVSPQHIKQMTEVYLKFLENPHMYSLEICRLPLILDIPTVENILIKDLFPTHKKRLLKIIKNIFNPFTLSSVKVHPNLVPLIFDRLLTFSTVDDKDMIISILNRYTKTINSLSIEDKQDIWGGNSLIFLCEKFKYVSESLFVHIGNRFSKNIIYFKRPKKLIKPIVDFNSALNKEMYTFGIFLKMLSSSGVKIQEESWFINNFLKKFEYNSELQRANFEYFTEAITLNPIFKENVDMFRRPEESHESGSENEFELFKQYAEKIEKEIDATYNNELMEKEILSPNLNLLEGSKLKMLIENMLNYCEFSNNTKKLNELCSFLNLEKIIKIVKKQISYPGLVEVLFNLYYKIGPNWVSQNCPVFDNALQGLKSTLNKNFYLKILTECETKAKENDTFDIKHMKNADAMFISATETFDYGKLELIEKNFEMEAINVICQQNSSLKQKFVHQFEKLVEGEEHGEKIRLFPFFVEYPFISDYLLICHSNISLIFFVSEQEKSVIYSTKDELSKWSELEKRVKAEETRGKYGSAIKHFQSENYKIVFLSCEEDIKSFITSLEVAKRGI